MGNKCVQRGAIVGLCADRIVRIGVLTVGIALIAFVGWAAFAPLSQGVVGQGVLVADSKRKTIQHLEGGIIKSIQVRDGSLVDKNQVLIELDPMQSRAQFELVRTRYLTSLAVLNRLNSEREGLGAIRFSDELYMPVGNDLKTIVRTQEKLFADRQHQFLGQISLLEQRALQLEEQVEGLTFELAARERALAHGRRIAPSRRTAKKTFGRFASGFEPSEGAGKSIW